MVRAIPDADWTGTDAQPCQMSYPDVMEHLAVLREKIGSLRAEIAHLQDLNAEYRRVGSQGRNEIQAQVAHGQRQERLQAIQQELAQLAGLGRRGLTGDQKKATPRPRIKSAS